MVFASPSGSRGTGFAQAASGPDLTAVKADDVSHVAAVGSPWTWTITVANGGDDTAAFPDASTILQDDLPAGPSYGAVTVGNVTGVTNDANISCAISSNSLTCTASGAEVDLDAGGSFDVSFSATTASPGAFDNPRSSGACAVDPDTAVDEADETNNACSDDVATAPDLTATKADNVGHTSTVGGQWTWTTSVANGGGLPATFADGDTILTDDLPTTGLSYGTPSTGNISGVTGAGNIACDITSNTLTCSASGGSVTLDALDGTFDVDFTATANASGTFDNPRSGGVCKVDPGTQVAEDDEGNNTCSDSVTVGAPDLTATKTDSAGGTVLLPTAWTWRIAVANGGAASATFSDGQTILTDDLPSSGLTYGAASVGSVTNVTGSANISCAIASNTLTCSASGGDVTLGATSGTFTVSFLTTPSTSGPFANPRSGGTCAVDPAGNVGETNEGNNACSETVTVNAPDLTATKNNNVSGTGNTGSPFVWSILVANAGTSTASFTSGQVVLLDNLPTPGLTYGAVSVSPTVPGMTCAIASNNLTCTAGAAGVTIAAGSSFTVSFNATPTAAGTYANPRTPGTCAVDPNGLVTEGSEANNACANSVSVNAPDLTAVKSNNVGGSVNIPNPWTWSILVSNGGAAPASFTNGQVVFRDNLPNSGLTYGAVSVSPAVAGMTCSISSSNLTCTAGSAGATIAAGSSFTVSFSATPTQGGTFNNPRSGGSNVCAADPDSRVAETSEANNSCSNSVTVNAPDLTVSKTDNVSNLASVNAPWTWTLAVTNTGQLSASFTSGQTVLLDQLPTTGMTYSGLTVSGSVSNVNCAIASNVLTCTAGSGGVTIPVGGTLNVAFTATSSSLNIALNPRLLGTCAVDPNNNVREVSESNSCSDIVVVLNAPDLTTQKTDTVGNSTTLGNNTWTWNVAVRNNLGGVQAVFPSGSTILLDNLPTGLTYGAPTVNGVVNITNSGNISCGITANNLTCTANGAAVTFGALFGQFNVAIPVTAPAVGTYANPRSGGTCTVDPNNSVSESNDNDNACSDTVTVTAPELTASKVDTVSNATTLGNNWQWRTTIANSGGSSGGVFTNGQVIFRDQLPTTGLTYSGVAVSGVTNVTNSGNINCAVASSVLTCTASGATVTIGAGTGTFTVSVTATPTAIGVYANPRSGGTCAVDPDSHSTETNEGNNTCSDTVTVTAPDMTATKTDEVGNATTLGNNWTWNIHVANTGNAPALFTDGKVLLHDNLPTTGLTYGPVVINAVTDVTNDANIDCAIAANVLTCSASGADVTLASATGSFDVSFTATPTATGTYTNPPSGGTCSVDPSNTAVESSEANNACLDTVVVTAPDLTVTKTDSVSGATTLGNTWTWQLAVANGGDGPAIFSDGETVLTDDLPTGLTYSAVTVSPAIPNLTCAITLGTLSCQADGGTATIGAGASSNVTFTATPSAIGVYDNPASGGICAIDPGDLNVESSEANNSCSDSVTVTAPDLTAVKTDNVGGATTLGNPWTWSIKVSNGGNSPALFANTQTVLTDNLPASGLAYSAVTVTPAVPNMTCAITGSTLTCSAGAAGVSIATGASFSVSFTATPSVIATYDNPTSAGTCAADPDSHSTESNEGNNACQDTVVVTAPDLTAVKTDNVSGATTLGNNWTWSIALANGGNSPALFASGQTVLTDNLPATGLTYGAVTVTPAIPNMTCSIAAGTLTCSASGGAVSIADGASSTLSFTATPTVIGVYDNPRAAGICAADPNDVSTESNEGNNACSDSVTVTAPDLTTLKSNTVGSATTLGNNWTWTIHVENVGNGPALFSSGQAVVRDNLPTTGLTYGAVSVTPAVANMTCSIAAGTLTCSAGAAGVSIASGAAFDITFTTTPTAIGVYDNPTTAGVCAADPDGHSVESDETNNACSDSVTVTAPDLTAVKTDDTGNATTLGNNWTWTIAVANGGNAPATFADGQTILSDALPATGLIYGTATVGGVANVTNSANIDCGISGTTLTCTANGADVTLGAGTGAFSVAFTATPGTIGAFANPPTAGGCSVDPGGTQSESDETNNRCSDTVTVTAPDLKATKTNNVSGATTLGNNWTWSIAVANAGNAPAAFANGDTIFSDDLPAGLTYGAVTVGGVTNVTNSGSISCAIAAGTLTCTDSGSAVTLGAGTGTFSVSFTATPSTIGVYANPAAAGACIADPNNVQVESSEGNNTCSNTVTVTAPDLTAVKTDTVGGAVHLGNSWTWRIAVANGGNAPAVFTAGQVILRDELPAATINYGAASVGSVTNVTNSGSISCSIAANVLTCLANGATVTLGAATGTFTVSFSATPTAVGVYPNPPAGKVCAADPDSHSVESDETNNNCSDNVGVDSPELQATKTDSVSNATALGNNWTWNMAITNTGSAAAVFASGQTVLTDGLPTTLTYGAVTISPAAANLSCAIAANLLTCTASGGSVSIGVGTTTNVSFTATPSVIGVYANPRGGQTCAIDPNNNITESVENNNACQDTVTVTAPDLTATKTNNVANATTLGNNWNWTIALANAGNGPAVFTNGQVVLRDTLPTSGLTYGAVSVTPAVANMTCGVAASVLTCTASGGTVSIANGTTVNVAVVVTPTVIGSYANPIAAGTCKADPDSHSTESNEGNNTCANTVTVTAPDLTAVKTNTVSGATTLGNNWTWRIAVANGGNAPAVFTAGQVILSDNLPSTGLTYGAATVGSVVNVTNSGLISCTITANNLTCVANGGTVTLGSATGAFAVSFTTTPTATGTYANPRAAGTCAVDPNGLKAESNEANNACSNSVTVTAPDLTAVKTNNVSGATTLGSSWTWTITEANGGAAPAAFANGQVILRDQLPATGLTYGAPSVGGVTNVTNSANINCAIAASVLTCTASGAGGVTIGSGTGTFAVSFTATPSTVGAFANPRAGGTCAADPNGSIVEGSEANNTCSNSVTVSAPDLTITKSNNVSSATTLGNNWTWKLTVANGGTFQAVFASGQTILTDNLPASGLTYGAVTVTPAVANVACSIATNTLTCAASGGSVTLASGSSFDVTFTATPSATGTYANPRSGGVCSVDPGGVVTESTETNNTCSNSVTVTVPDLRAVKTNNVSGVAPQSTPWTWTIAVSNGGTGPAAFSNGQVVLTDNLPTSGVLYGAVTVSPAVANLTCGITANTLTCTAGAGGVTIAAGTSFNVSFSATSETLATYSNPTSGGVCAVDPNSLVVESSEANNACSDSVVVKGVLTVTGSGNGSGTMAAAGTITCAWSGTVTSGDCSEAAASGTPFSITATAGTGSTFTGWTGCTTTSGPNNSVCNVTLDTSKTVTANFVIPDLTATKTNNVGGSTSLGSPLTWTIAAANTGSGPATFTSGQVILRDQLPTTGMSYGVPSVGTISNVTGTISCAVAASTLTCMASGGPVVMSALTGAFDVSLTATSTLPGTYANPRSGGTCAIDPDSHVAESSDANNTCSDSVTVTAPDLTATKTNDVSGATTLGGDWTWSIAVANAGNGAATFADGQTLLTDELPAGPTYGAPAVGGVAGVSNAGNIACAISANVLTCSASGGGVTLAATTGTFTVSFTATPSTLAVYKNPPAGKNCAADPDSAVTESAEANNKCSDTVTVGGTLSVSGAGAGTGSISGGAISCDWNAGNSGTCSTIVQPGGSVILTATPGVNSAFAGWTGCPDPSGPTCNVTNMTTDVSVTASFAPAHTVTVSGSGSGHGRITDGGVINCLWTGTANTGACSGLLPDGVDVILTASPVGAATFVGWTDCPSPAGPVCTIPSLSGDVSVTAEFAPAACGLLVNCSFEEPVASSGLPTSWSGDRLASGDGISTASPLDGLQTFLFSGTGKSKSLFQDVHYTGLAKSKYQLSFWTKSGPAARKGTYRIFVNLYQNKKSAGRFVINLPFGTHDWKEYVLNFTAKHDFNRIRVTLQFSKKGSAWFDYLLLVPK